MMTLVSLVFSLAAAAAFAESDTATPAPQPSRPQASSDICESYGTSLVATIDPQVLHLCLDGKTEKSFGYSAGRKGFAKRRAGDLKTPVGSYALALPRKSNEFGVFIGLGYPNPTEREKGFTGDAIGVHGPKRKFAFLGHLSLAVNWTQGCLAVATDREIKAIAQWLEDHPNGRVIHIVANQE